MGILPMCLTGVSPVGLGLVAGPGRPRDARRGEPRQSRFSYTFLGTLLRKGSVFR